MKKKFTFLIAALMLLTMINLPGKAVGQTTTVTMSTQGWTSGSSVVSQTVVNDYFTISFSKNGASTNPTYYTTSPAGVRLYAPSNTSSTTGNNGGSMTITAKDNVLITQIDYTLNIKLNANKAGEWTATGDDQITVSGSQSSSSSAQTLNNQTLSWEGSAETVSFQNTGESGTQVAVVSVKVSYTAASSPTITNLSCSGTLVNTVYEAGESFDPTGLTVTATYSDNTTADVTADVVWTPDPLTQGTTSVTGTYSGQTVTVNGITVTAPADPNIVLNYDNSPFTATSANSNTITKTLDGIEYASYGGYNYTNSSGNYISISRDIEGYLGNNTEFSGNIKKIVVNYATGNASMFTMYEGSSALSETTTVSPSSTGSGAITYTFSGNNGYFKFKRTTTGTSYSDYSNINSISIYLKASTNSAITVSTNSLEEFTYIEGQGPSDKQTFTVSGLNLTANLIMSLGDNSAFEISQSENSDYTNAIALAPISGAVSSTTIYARLKADKAKGNYSGTITLTSSGAAEKTISLSGSVTGQTYTLSDQSGEHGSITFDPSTPVEEGTHVTLTATAASDDYYFNGTWSFFKEDLTNVTENIVFVIGETNVIEMPAYNLLVDAGFVQKPTHATTCFVTGNGTVTPEPASTYEGQTVTLTIAPATGWDLSSISATYVDGNSATQTLTLSGSGNTRTFTMPNYNVTVEATFLSNTFEGNFVLFTGEMTEGDYLLVYDGGAMNTTLSNNRLGYTNVTPSNNIINNPDRTIVWHIAPSSTVGYWTIYNAKANRYASNSSANNTNMALVENPTYATSGVNWQASGSYEFRSKGNIDGDYTARYLRRNGDNGFASYQTSTGGALTLYKYTPERTITFNGNGGTYNNATTYTQTVLDGIATNLNPNQFIYGSSAFAGWSTTADGDVVYANGAPITVTGDITLYAKWSVGYTITYITNGITESTTTSVAAGNEIGVLIEPTAANIPNGYTFVGWYNDDIALTQTAPTYVTASFVPTADMTLKAVFATAKLEPSTENASLTLKAGDVTWASGSGYKSGTATKDGIEFAIENGMSSTDYIQLSKTDGRVYNTTPFIAITSITTTVGVNSILVYEGTAANPSSTTVSGSSNVYTFSDDMNYFAIEGDNKYTQVYFTINYVKPSTITTYSNYCTSVRILTLLDEATTYNVPCSIDPENGFIIEFGHTLTVDVLGNANAANLIIEDGGQLITSNAVAATVEKDIAAWNTGSTNGWYFISSPINDALAPSAVADMLTDVNESDRTYDLYSFDATNEVGGESKPWVNYRSHASGFTIENGMGYLYASEVGTTLGFSGKILPSNSSKTVSGLNANEFNLVGNPYTCDAYVNQPYFTLSQVNDGVSGTTTATLSSTAISPCTGVVVKPESTSVIFSKDAPVTSINHGNVQIALAQTIATRGESTSKTLDNAIVSFNEGSELSKFYFGQQNANIYIPQGNEEYAIVSAQARGEMPVNFKAHENGEYTLTINAEEVEMNYLHLIDNMTGADVDLLATPSYTFNARTSDYASRFRLVFSANGLNNENGNDDFAFISDGQIILTEQGTVQVYDITGRMISSHEDVTYITTEGMTAGVYVIRLTNGNDTKTQKIVVK